MVDHKGEKVDGDELLCILATRDDRVISYQSYLGVVGTVMSNLGLEQALKQRNIAFERTAVGDRYVLQCLQKKSWLLGGEGSGHIINLNHTTTGDGLITALQILRIIQMTEKSLHQLKQVMIKRPQVLINVPAPRSSIDLKRYSKLNQAVIEAGRELQNDGRVLLRASGTEPVLRVMVEGNDKKKIKSIAKTLVEQIIIHINGL